MKNKKKWASLLTVATSLILCIISTFGITLAFFGGNASANLSTITLKTGIEIGAAIESSVGSAKVVPGQPVKITATGTVSATTKGSANATNAVDGVVRAKFNVGNELGEVTIAGNNTDFWKEGGDGYYYLVTAANGTTLRTVSKGTSVQIFGDLTVSKNFTNADSGKSVEASVIFEVIQADIYKADGTKETLTVTNATTSGNAVNDAFKAIEAKATGSISITKNSEFFVGQSFATNNPKLTYTDENGNSRVISSYEVKSFDTTTLGEHTAVISYLGFNYNVTYSVVDKATFFANVLNNQLETPEENVYSYYNNHENGNEITLTSHCENGLIYFSHYSYNNRNRQAWVAEDGRAYIFIGDNDLDVNDYLYITKKYATQEEAIENVTSEYGIYYNNPYETYMSSVTMFQYFLSLNVGDEFNGQRLTKKDVDIIEQDGLLSISVHVEIDDSGEVVSLAFGFLYDRNSEIINEMFLVNNKDMYNSQEYVAPDLPTGVEWTEA